MATISELTVQVLTARLAKRDMSIEELENEFKVISKHLKAIEEGTSLEPNPEPAAETPIKVNMKKTFKANEVVCLICNKGFKTLKRHLAKAHNLTDNPTVTCSKCGAKANQPHNVCFPPGTEYAK